MEKDEVADDNDDEVRDISDRVALAEEEKRQLQTQVVVALVYASAPPPLST